MKTINNILALLILLAICSCEADNMEAPYCHIVGRMCYQGMNIGVKGSGNNQLSPSVQIELWQSGFGKESALDVTVAQDGSFSTYVYPGEVRIVTKNGVGPWQKADTIRAVVKGDMNIDYEVTPYFLISNVRYEFDKESKMLRATFHVEQVDESATVKSLGLLVNNTQFVDMTYNRLSATGSGQTGEVSFAMDCSTLTDCHALYARVFVRSDKSSYDTYSTEPYHVW